MRKGKTDVIVEKIVDRFSCFGGGRSVMGNPIADALRDKPPVFAAGVSVKDVVRFVLRQGRKGERG